MMLQQDVATRWNSTFYMMKSLLDPQWGLVENMTTLLTPFEQLTREISSHLATTANVIYSVVAL